MGQPATAAGARRQLRAQPGLSLSKIDAAGTGALDKDQAITEFDTFATVLGEAQERLYAERTRSLLLVMQGMDTSGKGGVTEHVVGAMSPAWVQVTSFKAPTDEEKAHHFLWRIRPHLPRPGHVACFDRSHYEDVGIVAVHGRIDEATVLRRYEEINAFEAEAGAGGTTVVKCFLHISPGEQRARLLARLDDPAKRWKFNEGDLDEREHWDEYMAAYSRAIDHTNPDTAPWYVIPADKKWYRNWALAKVVVETFEELDPQYPEPDLDIAALRARLG